MKKTILTIFCMAAGIAWAEDEDISSAVAVDQVEDRISVIEVIDVTAEKTPALSADDPDDDIDAILEEADWLDDEEEGVE